jgi:hypothetical protein
MLEVGDGVNVKYEGEGSIKNDPQVSEIYK